MRKSKSSLFLMELIIVIFFFSLTSAVCLQVFVKAHLVDKESMHLSAASLMATNVGECFYNFHGDARLICDALNTPYSDSGLSSFTDKEDYEVNLFFFEDDDYSYLTLSYVYNPDNQEIYNFTYKANKREVVSE